MTQEKLEQLKEILRGITAVKEFHFMGDCEEEHCVKAEIKTDPSSDIRELLLSAGRKESSDPCHAACETVTGRYLPRTDCR